MAAQKSQQRVAESQKLRGELVKRSRPARYFRFESIGPALAKITQHAERSIRRRLTHHQRDLSDRRGEHRHDRGAAGGLLLGDPRQNPVEIAYWERGEWWLAGDPSRGSRRR